MKASLSFRLFGAPVILSVPGLDNSGPSHWQSIWEAQRNDMARVDLGMWGHPHRNSWVTRLGQAIRASSGPIILCAHSLGCLAVAWWATLEGQAFGKPVAGALLVAPPDCDRRDVSERISGFGPTPRGPLPFPSLLVASRDDPYATIDWSRSTAAGWGSEFMDAGELGHINAESGIGDWPGGQRLLDRLCRAVSERDATPAPRAQRYRIFGKSRLFPRRGATA